MKQLDRHGAAASWLQRAPLARFALTAGAALALLATTACNKGKCVAGDLIVDGATVQGCACDRVGGAAEATRRFSVTNGVALERDALSCNSSFGGHALCCADEGGRCACTVVAADVTMGCAGTASSFQVSGCATPDPPMSSSCADPPLDPCSTDADCSCDRRCIAESASHRVCTKECFADDECFDEYPSAICAAYPGSGDSQTYCQ